MRLFCLILLCALFQSGFAQNSALLHESYSSNKPSLTLDVIKSWPTVASPDISNDGGYIKYFISNHPNGSKTCTIRSTSTNWHKEFILKTKTADVGRFDWHGKHFILKGDDTLYLIQLGGNKVDVIPNIFSYKCPADSGLTWIAYQLIGAKNLVLRNLMTNNELKFSSVSDYFFSNKGKVLIIVTELLEHNSVVQKMTWIDLLTGHRRQIWSYQSGGEKTSIVANVFDDKNEQLAFQVETRLGAVKSNTIWYYKKGMDSAKTIVSDYSESIKQKFLIQNQNLRFSKNSKYVLFSLTMKEEEKPRSALLEPVIWSYKDEELLINQEQSKAGELKIITALVCPSKSNQILFLETGDEKIFGYDNGDFILVVDNTSVKDYWIETFECKTLYLVSLVDGTRRVIRRGRPTSADFSPNGKFVIYFDPVHEHYFTFDLQSGETVNISKRIPVRLTDEYVDYPGSGRQVGIAAWGSQDSCVFIYDNYDIWRVDPKGVKVPVNVTNGYGIKNRVKLRLLSERSQIDGTIYLTAFNTVDKHNGFYRLNQTITGSPEQLIMSPFDYFHVTSQVGSGSNLRKPMRPIKARFVDKWIVQRMSPTEAPNYFITSDFIRFIPVSNIQPQETYNWLTTELVRWQQSDGSFMQGVLYKPEDFDSTKKYPLIFHYYERMSHRLFQYPSPGPSDGSMNIAWFVSNHYLVFTPDIHYLIGRPGESAFNSIVSAANYLSKRRYVNANKMGLQGHSFGGFETNQIITNTSIFAAAASAAGLSNLTSLYGNGEIKAVRISNQSFIETGQMRMGATLWQRTQGYLENSPVFKADEIRTPLLLMHGKKDGVVPFSQAVELFTALRRLNKKVWLLQYDKGDHYLNGNDAIDYTIRLTQFFDYYLKDAVDPKWMNESDHTTYTNLNLEHVSDCGDRNP